ncbi:V-type ATP synthase subunit F [Candidatus Woesearchaeota archaeon]|nr:V-type ATP synthase subunit F [Candidatus Woesearchaeota archaeon]
MVNVAVLGSNEFVVGFQLAGIKNIVEATDDHFNDIKEIKNKEGVGIVVLEQKIMDSLDEVQRQEVEDSVEPVFIPVSIELEQESLKRLIKKSIGVDLWS